MGQPLENMGRQFQISAGPGMTENEQRNNGKPDNIVNGAKSKIWGQNVCVSEPAAITRA